MFTVNKLRQKLSKTLRYWLHRLLIKYKDKQSLPAYVNHQLDILNAKDLVDALKSLTSDVKFQVRTSNVESLANELFKLNHLYSKDESLRSVIRGSGQHTVSAAKFITDNDGNYLDGNELIPGVFSEIRTLTENYQKNSSGQTSRNINNAFILEHYLKNISETLDAWLSITYGN